MPKSLMHLNSRRLFLSSCFCLFPIAVKAQGNGLLTFMGVSVVGADRTEMSKAAKIGGGQSKGSRNAGTEIWDVFGFPPGKLPGGIRGVTFIYDQKERLISVDCKVPAGSLLELKDGKKPNALLELLERKYGLANRTKVEKGLLEDAREYIWHFDSGGTISLKELGTMKGMLLSYFDSNRERTAHQRRKDSADNAL